MISLELRDISKSFGEREILSGINATVDSGCLVVTGSNGSGKSTLLKIIAGLLSATSGEAVIHNATTAQRRDLIGLVAPDLALYDELTAMENLRFFAKVRGIRRPDSELNALLCRLGLDERQNDLLSSFSSGMKQRVKFAFALLHEPAILLLDEPSTNLDETGIVALEGIITEQRQNGIVIIATNDRSELRYGDQVLELGVA